MKKIFLSITLALICITGFANNSLLSQSDFNSAEVISDDSVIQLDYNFNSVEQLKAFDTEKISELDFSAFDNGEDDCEVTGTVSVTVTADVGIPGFGGLEVSATITLTVTASCAEIADALANAAATAKRIAMQQLTDI